MTITKATASKNKFSVRKNNLNETDDNSRSRVKNFDLGNSKINLSYSITGWIGILIGIISLVFGITWFIAAEWRFAVKTANFELEMKNNFYTKEETDILINNIDVNKPLNDFKNCILQNQGYWPCLK